MGTSCNRGESSCNRRLERRQSHSLSGGGRKLSVNGVLLAWDGTETGSSAVPYSSAELGNYKLLPGKTSCGENDF